MQFFQKYLRPSTFPEEMSAKKKPASPFVIPAPDAAAFPPMPSSRPASSPVRSRKTSPISRSVSKTSSEIEIEILENYMKRLELLPLPVSVLTKVFQALNL